MNPAVERIRAALYDLANAEPESAEEWTSDFDLGYSTDPLYLHEVIAHVDQQAAEIATLKAELHQHECNNFDAVREQRDFLLASQALLIESANSGQEAQQAEIDRLSAESDERLKNSIALVMEIDRLRAQQERKSAWHDAPTEPGLWVQWLPGIGNTFEYVGDYTYSGEWGGRWYGPIPEDR